MEEMTSLKMTEEITRYRAVLLRFDGNWKSVSLPPAIDIYIYIYIYMCVCVCVHINHIALFVIDVHDEFINSATICKLVDLIPAIRQSDCRIPNWVSAKTVLSSSTNHGQTTARFRSFFR